MFYEPSKNNHNLPHDPFKACVIPRPIGWISTVSISAPPVPNRGGNGSSSPKISHNLAPYSQFNNLTFDPPYVMFSANHQPDPLYPGGGAGIQKDTVRNVESTGVFVWNLATWDLRDKVNITAEQFSLGVDEFAKAGLAKEDSKVVSVSISTTNGAERRIPVPMVKDSPVRFECEYYTTLRLPGNPPVGAADVVIGRVVGVHIADWALTDGKLDVRKTKPIARLGYYEYAVVKETFDMIIPGTDEVILAGLEGSKKRVDEVTKGKL